MTDTTENTAKPMRRWVKFLLAASLAMNLLVIGAVGSAIFAFKTGSGPFGAHKMGSSPFSFALSRQDRKRIGREIRQQMQSQHKDLPKPGQIYLELQRAMTAEVYDKDAVHALITAHQDTGMKQQAIAQRLFLERLDNMTVAQRQKFAKRLGHIINHNK